MVRTMALPLLGAALFGPMGPLAAQSHDQGLAAAITRGDHLHSVMKPDEALLIFEEVLFEAPRNYDVLWRAARESVVLGLVAEEGRVRKGRLRQGETYARLAISSHKSGVEGHYWLSVALSGLVPLVGVQNRVGLLEEIRGEADRVLASRPEHAGAHQVLGLWHAEVMRLSNLATLVAKTVWAHSSLKTASWEEAERLLSRSAELDPHALTPRLELARVYLDTARPDRARHTLQEILALPAEGPLDPAAKDRARPLLMELQAGPGAEQGSRANSR